jgi:hypothetical protein
MMDPFSPIEDSLNQSAPTINPFSPEASTYNNNVPEPTTQTPTYTTPQYGTPVTPGTVPTTPTTPDATTQTSTTDNPPTGDPPAGDPSRTYEAATDPASFASIQARLASPGYDKPYTDLYAGNMRQGLMNTADANRRELSNRLASSGIEGGVAQDQLGSVDRAASMGTASGLADILKNSMNEGFTNLRAAGQNELSSIDKQITMEAIKQQYGLQTYEDQMKFTLSLLQMAQYANAPEAATLMQMAMALLSGDTTTGNGA